MSDQPMDLDGVIQNIKDNLNIKVLEITTADTSSALFAIEIDDEGHVDVLTVSDTFDLPEGISETDLIDDQLDNLIPGVKYGVFVMDIDASGTNQLPERIGVFNDCFALYRVNDQLEDELATFKVVNGTLVDINYSEVILNDESGMMMDYIKKQGINAAAKHIYHFLPGGGEFSLYAVSEQKIVESFRKYTFNEKNAKTHQLSQEVDANLSIVEQSIILTDEVIEGAKTIATYDAQEQCLKFNMSYYDFIDIKDAMDVPMEAFLTRVMELWKSLGEYTAENSSYIVYIERDHSNTPEDKDTAVSAIDDMLSMLGQNRQ